MTQTDSLLPRRGNRLTRALTKGIMRLAGWRITGALPNLPKMVVIGAPHSSNWDFFLAMAFMLSQNLRISWVAKNSFIESPLKPLLRWLGGVGVDRSKSSGVVQQVVDVFNAHDRFMLAISPEGTRANVREWRSGFYHIAHGAGVPIVPVVVNYGRKELHIAAPFTPSGDFAADLPRIKAIVAAGRGRKGELA